MQRPLAETDMKESPAASAVTARRPVAIDQGVAKDLTFEDVYEQYFDFVWKTARRLGVPTAIVDDAAQEAFVIVHRKLHEFEGRSSVKTWLFGIVRNVARDARRTERRKSPHTQDGARQDAALVAASPEGRPDHLAERSAENRMLYALLDELEDDRRDVFVLAELEQMSIPEIAITLELNVNTTYSRLRLAREDFSKAAARLRAKQKGTR